MKVGGEIHLPFFLFVMKKLFVILCILLAIMSRCAVENFNISFSSGTVMCLTVVISILIAALFLIIDEKE